LQRGGQSRTGGEQLGISAEKSLGLILQLGASVLVEKRQCFGERPVGFRDVLRASRVQQPGLGGNHSHHDEAHSNFR